MDRERDPLIRYLTKPDRSRLEEAVRAYHAFVWEVALRITGDREAAADVCQDVFLKLLLEPPPAASVAAPAGYLAWRAIGRARFLTRCGERRKAREREVLERVAGPGIAPEDLEEVRKAVEGLPDD